MNHSWATQQSYSTHIIVVRDFSPYPTSRELAREFQEKYILPNLKKYDRLVVDFSQTYNISSSFLDEAFGKLITDHNYCLTELEKRLKIIEDYTEANTGDIAVTAWNRMQKRQREQMGDEMDQWEIDRLLQKSAKADKRRAARKEMIGKFLQVGAAILRNFAILLFAAVIFCGIFVGIAYLQGYTYTPVGCTWNDDHESKVSIIKIEKKPNWLLSFFTDSEEKIYYWEERGQKNGVWRDENLNRLNTSEANSVSEACAKAYMLHDLGKPLPLIEYKYYLETKEEIND